MAKIRKIKDVFVGYLCFRINHKNKRQYETNMERSLSGSYDQV